MDRIRLFMVATDWVHSKWQSSLNTSLAMAAERRMLTGSNTGASEVAFLERTIALVARVDPPRTPLAAGEGSSANTPTLKNVLASDTSSALRRRTISIRDAFQQILELINSSSKVVMGDHVVSRMLPLFNRKRTARPIVA